MNCKQINGGVLNACAKKPEGFDPLNPEFAPTTCVCSQEHASVIPEQEVTLAGDRAIEVCT